MGDDAVAGFGVFFERQIEQLGNALAGKVVTGWAKAAGDEDQLGASNGFTCGGLDGVAGVGHGLLMSERVARAGELLGEPMVMGVENAPEKEFAAGVDEFHAHGRSVPRRWITRNLRHCGH